MNLNGKRVLVTGGSSGIGLAIAEAILAEGARVVVTGRRPDALKAAIEGLRRGSRFVEGVAADVSTDNGRAATLAFALQKLGGLDVLVNNAGGVRAGRLEDTTEDEIRTNDEPVYEQHGSFDMRPRQLIFIGALAAVCPPIATAAERPVVVELFTSQGCSSCPPANAYRNELSKRPSPFSRRVVYSGEGRAGFRAMWFGKRKPIACVT
jgi:hypothetical protein